MAFNFTSPNEGLPPSVVCVTCVSLWFHTWTAAYDEDSIKWIELLPYISGKASSLQSQKQVELTPFEMSKNYNAPLYALSDIVLVEALCRSQAIFFLTLDGNSNFYVECLVHLRRICKTCPACELIMIPVVKTGTMLYQFANLHFALVLYCMLANAWLSLSPASVVSLACGKG